MRALVIGIGVVLITAVIVAWWSGGAGSSGAALQAPRFEGETLRASVELEPFVAPANERTTSIPEASVRRSTERDVVAGPGEFRLRAVDVRGNALPFAVLEVAEGQEGDNLPERIVADRDGRFAWISAAPAVVLKVTTSRMGILLAGEVRCEIAHSRTAPYDVVLEPVALVLSGRAVDTRGMGIEGARVRAALVMEKPRRVHEPREVEDAQRAARENGGVDDGLPTGPPNLLLVPKFDLGASVTDSRGAFHVQSQHLGGWIRVDVEAEGYLPMKELAWVSGTSGLTIVLEAVAEVKGRLALHPSVRSFDLDVVARSLTDTSLSQTNGMGFREQFQFRKLARGSYALQLDSDRIYAPSLDGPIVLSIIHLAEGQILDVGEIDLSHRLLGTRLDFSDRMHLVSVDEHGIRVQRAPDITTLGHSNGDFVSAPSVLHGPGEWIVPLHAEGYRSTHVQLTGGEVRVELEREGD